MDDVTAVTQLVLHERQARDRLWWDAMGACYAADSAVRLSWFQGSGSEFVDRSRGMAANGDRSAHRLGPPIVDVRGRRALAEVPAIVEIPTELDGVEVLLASCNRLLFRAVQNAGGWRIVSLDPVYERDSLTPTVPGTTFRIDPRELHGHRTAYRFLQYVLRRRGHPVADDLYGDDRPEDVAALYERAHAWLRAG